MSLSISDIATLFARHGHQAYSGEAVTQQQHALQSALLAEQHHAAPSLVAASLLHDLGHLLNDQGETPSLRGIDDAHQYFAIPFLRGLFDDAVLEPIRLHVDAKRYLCHARPEYYAALSADSKRSLVLQGGIYSSTAAAQFIARPHAGDAVLLRQWDDQAKIADLVTPPLTHYLQVLEGIVIGK